jgi:hypothetical protein
MKLIFQECNETGLYGWFPVDAAIIESNCLVKMPIEAVGELSKARKAVRAASSDLQPMLNAYCCENSSGIDFEADRLYAEQLEIVIDTAQQRIAEMTADKEVEVKTHIQKVPSKYSRTGWTDLTNYEVVL